jgi:hypothetical protein
MVTLILFQSCVTVGHVVSVKNNTLAQNSASKLFENQNGLLSEFMGYVNGH